MPYWLINGASKMARRTPGKRKKKRPVPAGFTSWKEYMASIRPGGKRRRTRRRKSTGGSTMAKRRRRRRRATTSAPRRRRRRSYRRNGYPAAALLANPRRRRRRRRSYRRNPFGIGSLNVKSFMAAVQEAAIDSAGVVTGKAIARIARKQIASMGTPDGKERASMAGGTQNAALIEAGIATVVGILAQRFVGRRIAHNLTVGGYVAGIEQMIKKADIPYISPALGDDGGNGLYSVRSRRMSGYGPASRLNGYAPRGRLGQSPGEEGLNYSAAGIGRGADYVDDIFG